MYWKGEKISIVAKFETNWLFSLDDLKSEMVLMLCDEFERLNY